MALADDDAVMKLYNTKANALANGTTGRFTPDNGATSVSDIGSGHAGLIYNAEGGAATSGDNAGPFYIYQNFLLKIFILLESVDRTLQLSNTSFNSTP